MKKGFTLAEVLITLAIIGVVAALTIPSVILNTNQQEYKTGLKKAVSVLNQAISMNMALDNVAPSDLVGGDGGKNLVDYLADKMNTLTVDNAHGQFYTTDGMRFQVVSGSIPNVGGVSSAVVGGCKDTAPCVVIVDVNGDRKPSTFENVTTANFASNVPDNAQPTKDIFYIKITGDGALPLGNLAENTMFQ